MVRRGLAACVLALIPVAVSAQNHFALEILTPLPVNTAGTGLDADNRVFWAYPTLEYNIRVVARGGRYPYTYALTGQPVGMAIEAGPCTSVGPTCTAGTITWTPADASADDASITVTVTDADGDTASATWGIDVVDPATQTRFWFVHATSGSASVANGGTGTGTLANPWASLEDVYEGTGADDITYFRGGTYTMGGLVPTYNTNDDDVNGEERVEWNTASRSTIWMAYPGDTPIIDFEYTGDGCGSTSSPTFACGQSVPRFRMTGGVTYIDGLTVTRMMVMGFQMDRSGRYGTLVRRSTFSEAGPGLGGGNPSMIMWIATYGGGGTPGTQVYGDIVMNSTFTNTTGIGSIGALKTYSWLNGVISDNTFTDFTAGVADVEGISLKADVTAFTVRSNIFDRTTLGGNNDSHNTGELTGGEVLHNIFKGTGTEYIGESRVDCCLGEFFVYRNTFIGPAIQLHRLDTGDGPITFTQNVIVNADTANGSCPAKFDCVHGGGLDVVDYGTFSLSNNLTGVAADSITDASGTLLGSYLTTYGPSASLANRRGHMLGAAAADPGVAGAGRPRSRARMRAD